MESITKQCRRCGHVQKHRIVSKGKGRKRAARFCCIDCDKDRENDPVKGRTALCNRIKRWAIDYCGGKCSVCGFTDECVSLFDFHHLDPKQKEFTVSVWLKKNRCNKVARSATSLADLPELIQELDKCHLLCALCHRRKHYCCKRKGEPVS